MHKPVCLLDFENYACQVLPKAVLDYYRSGAGSEITLRNNRAVFSEFRIRPKLMTNVKNRNMLTTAMGTNVSMPIGISPTAMQGMAHTEGECATAKAAEEMGSVFVLSTFSNFNIEEVAAAAPNAIKWFQLYIYKDREVTANLVRRIEKSGYKAIVLITDSPVFAIRFADVRNNFRLPSHLKLANFVGEEATGMHKQKSDIGLTEYVGNLIDPSVVWDDIKWLRTLTTLPIIAKGILTAEDALKAVEVGVSGILVSNHGGRQVNGAPATIEALPEIVKAVGNQVEIYVDGGVREGVDVLKALALGAKMVFVGRPILWGLTYNGQKGVSEVLQILKNEFDNAMALTGCSSLKDISKDIVVHKNYYSQL